MFQIHLNMNASVYKYLSEKININKKKSVLIMRFVPALNGLKRGSPNLSQSETTMDVKPKTKVTLK